MCAAQQRRDDELRNVGANTMSAPHLSIVPPTAQVLAMQNTARLIYDASNLRKAPEKCVPIDVVSVLLDAAQTLRHMASCPNPADFEQFNTHQELCDKTRPIARAQKLEVLARNLQRLDLAMITRDTALIRRFFEIHKL